MAELDIQQLILESVRELSSKQERLHDKIDELNINYAIQSKDISQIKEDLARHIEGTIQNRERIEILEKHDGEQAVKLSTSIEKIKNDIEPVVEYIAEKKNFPKRLMAWIYLGAKLLAAIAAVGAASTGIIKLISWIITQF
jgi:hypothetical protein